MSAGLPIQKAVYDALTGDGTLNGMVRGVYDFTPQGEAYPYITIGEDTLTDFGAHTFDGFDATLNIHTWARGAGRKLCKEIMAEVYRILHNNSLTVEDYKTLSLRQDFEETFLDQDGQTYHGIQRFRLLLGEE